MGLDDLGFVVIEALLSTQDVERLLASLSPLKLEPRRGGIRCIERLLPEVAALAHAPALLDIAKDNLQGAPQLVRALYFDKGPENNWSVTWHQDRTVAVSQRFTLQGWGPWTLKAGIWHVQPPIEVLENMLTVRVHLDPATAANGCLKIVPGSHRLGLIPSARVPEQINTAKVLHCEVALGGAVVMRPHLLHASEKSRTATARRVLHFEYSGFPLPEGVTWAA